MVAFSGAPKSGPIDASTFWQTGNWTPVWYMAGGQSPLSFMDTSGWSPGTALDWMFSPGSRKLWLWPGKSTKWANSSHSAQRTPHSCTFFHCQGRGVKEGRGEREAEWGTVGGSWTGPASKTWRVVVLEQKKEKQKKKKQLRPILDIKLYFGPCCVLTVGNHTKSLWVVFFEWLGTLSRNYNQRYNDGDVLWALGEHKMMFEPLSVFLRGNLPTIGSLIFIHIAWVLLISSSFSIKEGERIHFTSLCDSQGVAEGHGEEKSRRYKDFSSQEDGRKVQFNRWIIFCWG